MNILGDDYNWESHLRDDDGNLLCTRCSGIGVLFAPIWIDSAGKEYPPITMACHSCRGSGLLVHMLVSIARRAELDLKIEKERHEKLKNWVQKTSTCKICEGNAMKTPGGCPCEECTLMGECPWGG